LAELFATSASSEKTFAMGKSLSDQRERMLLMKNHLGGDKEVHLGCRTCIPPWSLSLFPRKISFLMPRKLSSAAHAFCSVPNDGKIAKDMSPEDITSGDFQFNVPTYRNNKLF